MKIAHLITKPVILTALCCAATAYSLSAAAETNTATEAIEDSAEQNINPITAIQTSPKNEPLYFDWQVAPNSVCRGYYTPPPFPQPELATPYDQSITTITFNRGELFTSGSSTLSGNVVIEQPQFRLYADKVTIERSGETGEVTSSHAQGHVLLEQPTLRLISDTADINLIDKSGTLTNSYYRFYQSHGRGNATFVQREPDGTLKLYDASYTVCPPYDNTWYLRAKEVSLNQEKGRGTARHAKLYLKDIPILYSPYLTFPINDERKSGFLTPNYERSTLRGEEFIVPFYLNLAPNYDFTVTSHYMSKRNFLEEGEFRYLLPHAVGDLFLQYVPNDPAWHTFQFNNITYNPRHLPPGDIRLVNLENSHYTRGAISYQNNSILNRYTILNGYFNYVSDDNYLVDFQVPSLDSNVRQLERQINVAVETPIWSFGTRALAYQVLQPYDATISAVPYRMLPQLMAKANVLSGPLGLDYGLYTEGVYFDQDTDPFTRTPLTTGSRVDFAPTIDIPLRNSFAYFIPRAEWRVTTYSLDLGTVDQLLEKAPSATRSIPLYDIDAGLFFDREFSLFNQNYSQTLEPRLFYLYVPYKNQNELPVFDSGMEDLQYIELFYTNRFSGRDRVGDANQLTYAVVTRFNELDSGIERTRISLGQIIYFRNRLVSLCDSDVFPNCVAIENPNWNEPISPLVGELHYAFTDLWYASAQTQWNMHERGRLDQAGLWITYRADNDYMFDVGYRYIWQGNPVGAPVGSPTNNLEQLMGSFSYRLNSRWHFLGGWQYDVINTFTIDGFGGVEYENCCWATRVGARRQLTVNSSQFMTKSEYREYDTGFYIQFVFKGLATLGTDPGTLFVEKIPGYQDYFGKRY